VVIFSKGYDLNQLYLRASRRGRHMKKKTLGFKLVSGGIIAVLIPLLIVGIFAVMKTSGALEALALNQSMEIAKGIANMSQLAVEDELKIV
jgi:methyl-accepting chemotaxis protein